MSKADISSKIGKAQNAICVCKSKNPEGILIDLCSILQKKFKKICVVSVAKPCSSIIQEFEKEKIRIEKFHFIDCISSSLVKQPSLSHCNFISSPKALTELAIALNNLPKEVDLVILNSFSELSFYNDNFMTLRFMNSVSAKLHRKSITLVSLIKKETRVETISDLSLLADKIISL